MKHLGRASYGCDVEASSEEVWLHGLSYELAKRESGEGARDGTAYREASPCATGAMNPQAMANRLAPPDAFFVL
jgi:hypothetical protein